MELFGFSFLAFLDEEKQPWLIDVKELTGQPAFTGLARKEGP